MQDVLLYMSAFCMIFLSCAVVCFCLRFSIWIYLEYWSPQAQLRQHNNRQRLQARTTRRDRQGNVFTIHDETSRDHRYNDIFFIEPNSVEAARIRSQLEKDEKDLPSYDEVMRMANLSTPAADAYGLPAPATGAANPMNASSSSVNTTETTLTVPPYTEVDLTAISSASRPMTPPPYSPPTVATSVVALPIITPIHTQHSSSSNV